LRIAGSRIAYKILVSTARWIVPVGALRISISRRGFGEDATTRIETEQTEPWSGFGGSKWC
jgi:hypothetical protein